MVVVVVGAAVGTAETAAETGEIEEGTTTRPHHRGAVGAGTAV